MTKITLTNLVNLQNETTAVGAINANNATLVAALDNTLSRDGTTPNQMNADLDMNSNSILNLPTPTSNYEPLRLIDAATISGGGITVSPLPAGGGSGQVLEKNSSTNYDVSWKTNVGMPAGGTLDQVLSKNSSTDYDASWKSQTNIFNVLNYGAVGDGVTNSTNAILAALAAAETYATTLGTNIGNSQMGATLYFPQGVYYISAPLVIPRAISLVGDGVSTQILANDCDAIQLSLPAIAGGLQSIRNLWINGQNSTSARNAVFFGGSLTINDIISGLLFEDLYITNFDTVFRLSGVQNVWFRNVFAQYLNQGFIFTGVVYNTYIQDCTIYSIAGLNPSFGSSYTGLSLYKKNYTVAGGLLPPEGIFCDNLNLYGFQIGIDADACDTLQIHHSSIVALVYGFRFNNVTTINNFTDSSVEMHSSTALAGIYGVPLSAFTTSHRTVLMDNTLQGVPGLGSISTTQCTGIQINASGQLYQDNVIIQNNYIKSMNVYDISLYNPGGNTRAINNYCFSPSATGSILCGTPNPPSEILVQGNTCNLTIDYATRLTDWPAGTLRSENNTINNGTSEQSSWNLTSPVARFTTFAGPTAARTYTLPDATDTIATIAATQTLTNKTINGSNNTVSNIAIGTAVSGLGTNVATFLGTPSSANLAAALTDETGTGAAVFASGPTLVAPALGTPASGVATNLTGTAASLTAGHVTTNANLTGPITSSGNATSVAAQTGTGSTFVMNTSPTLVTPALGVATATSINGANIDNLAWTAYTPTITATTPGTTTYTLNSARWKQIGKTVFVQVDFTITSAGTGSGPLIIPLPLTAAAFRYAGIAIEYAITGRSQYTQITASATFATLNDFAGTPFAFANGQKYEATLTYEVP